MKKQTSLKRNDVISASDIGQYVFCSNSWHLQRGGYEPVSPLLEVGKKSHIDLGNTIDNIQSELYSARRFAIIGYVLLVLAIIAVIYEVIL
ncbi:MAG: hypothetical protein ACOC80_11270 [Petrotogales bacterium]